MQIPSHFRSRAAFTLIELLTVMAIILVLAGIILGTAGHVQYKAAKTRAETEIKAMENALEAYKADNGTYVRDPNNITDALNAQNSFDPSVAAYTNSCKILYQALSGYGTTTDATTGKVLLNKSYMTFTPGQLSTGSATPDATTYIIDPFGFSYGYSTNNQYAVDNQSPTATAGYNPTFDLWSTAGYSPAAGKPYPTDLTSGAQRSVLWVKNW